MAPAGQGAVWSEVLCCPLCSHLFSSEKLPVNLSCGHTLCRCCMRGLASPCCPLDQTSIATQYEKLPINVALMSILGIDIRGNPHAQVEVDQRFFRVETILVKMSYYLKRAESERGGSVWSEDLSRPIQRKLLALLCFQLTEDEGRQRALKTAKGLAERILTELLIAHQNNNHLSSSLWSAVRARGCQFLGPAMQEEVLRLILLTLSEGALIARKTLVMYIVQTLGEDYPQVSKTCVGHVVQLLYRASCFNVIKREGESSLMQLKSEFRDYDTLRREHDSQIVQIAMEAGLRVSPDQWSALLYGDQSHRSHMQSIIDKLQSPEAFDQMIRELHAVLQRNNDPESLLSLVPRFERFSRFDATNNEFRGWLETVEMFDCLSCIVDVYVQFTKRRSEQRVSNNIIQRAAMNTGSADLLFNDRRYKTRLCRDVEAGRVCPRGARCTYAHSKVELRRPVPRRQQISSHTSSSSSDPLTLFSLSSDSRLIPQTPGDSRMLSLQSFAAPCDMHPMPPPPPNPVGVVPVTPIPQPPNRAVVIDPRQPIAMGADASGLVSVPVPVVPVVVQGPPAVEPANGTIPVVPVVVQGAPGVATMPTVDAAAPAPSIPIGTISMPNGRVERHPEPMPQPATVMMLAHGNPISNARPPQPVMLSTMWQVPPPQQLNGTTQNPSQVISLPVGVPPSQMSFDVNGVRWLPPCGQIVEDIPVDCAERYWPIFDDMRCAVTVTRASALDTHVIPIYNGRHSSQIYQSKSTDSEEEEQLKIRRSEIISRLAVCPQNGSRHVVNEESADDDDLQSHVSYTVANSVLYDEKEVSVVSTTGGTLQLPPIPLRFNTAPPDEAISRLTEATGVSAVVISVCSPCVYTSGTKPATVQAPCAIMQVKDTISQPLPTPAIQRPYNPQLTRQDIVNPSVIVDRLPPVIRPFPMVPADPQNFVSSTLDRIVDVRERLNDVEKNGGLGCSAEKQQLRVELNIASRQIQSLDQKTKQSCLLRELEAVEKKMENLNVHQ